MRIISKTNKNIASKTKKLNKRIKQEEKLARFVQDYDHYEERQVGEEFWVKQYNGNSDKWQIAVYSRESFRNYKKFKGGGIDL